MLQRAAAELNLDLSRSWVIGDMISDALAGTNAGCQGAILVRTGAEPPLETCGYVCCDDLVAAVGAILDKVGGDRL